MTKGWRIRHRTGSKEPLSATIRNLCFILQATGSEEIIFRVKPFILRNKCQFTYTYKKYRIPAYALPSFPQMVNSCQSIECYHNQDIIVSKKVRVNIPVPAKIPHGALNSCTHFPLTFPCSPSMFNFWQQLFYN